MIKRSYSYSEERRDVEKENFYNMVGRIYAQLSPQERFKATLGSVLLPSSRSSTTSITIEKTPIGDHCSRSNTDSSDTTMTFYDCGGVRLGTKMNDKVIARLSSIELKGSLFPMRVGAEASNKSISTSIGLFGSESSMTVSTVSRVASKGMARNLDPKLKGVAWKISRKITITSPHLNNETVREEYFLEDLGVFLSDIAEYEPDETVMPQGMAYDKGKKRTFFFPSPGQKMYRERDFPNRIEFSVKTVIDYDWTVSK